MRALAIPALLAGLLACAPAASPPTDLAPEALAARIAAADAPLVLDVRSEAEYRSGHVPGALHIPHTELAGRIAEVEARLADADDGEIVVYCESGRRAAIALELLETRGFGPLRHLDGDMARWREDGRPTESE